jgi:hypothetical protein
MRDGAALEAGTLEAGTLEGAVRERVGFVGETLEGAALVGAALAAPGEGTAAGSSREGSVVVALPGTAPAVVSFSGTGV